MTKKLVLIGAGGFGREVALIIEGINKVKPTYELLGFLDDNSIYQQGTIINGYPWIGKKDWILEHKEDVLCVCTIADPDIKEKVMTSFMEQGVQFESIIARSAYCGAYNDIGPGCVIYGGVSLSANCKIGTGVLLNRNVTIGHDVTIGDYTYIMPGTGISGGCSIGTKAKIGGHAYVIPGKKIGDGATLAAGSIVFANVRSGATVVGNPAKRMRELE